MSVNAITHEPLELSSQNLQGIILGSKGRPSSKMALLECVAGDLMSDVLLYNFGSDGVLEDMSLASTVLEDTFSSPWLWPWPRGSCLVC